MSGRLPWIVALIAIVALGTGWFSETKQRQHDVQEMQHRLELLEGAIPRGGQAIDQDRATYEAGNNREAFARRVAGSMDAEASISDPRSQRTAAEIDQNRSRDRARLEARLAADGSDPRWAMETEESVSTSMAEPALAPFAGPESKQVQCARTMCRMVFTFNSSAAAEDWGQFYPSALAAELPVMHSQQTKLPDGRIELRLYGFRDSKANPHQ